MFKLAPSPGGERKMTVEAYMYWKGYDVKELSTAIGLCETREELSRVGKIGSSNYGSDWIWALVDEGLVTEHEAHCLRISSEELMKRVPESKRVIREDLTKEASEPHITGIDIGYNIVQTSSEPYLEPSDVDYWYKLVDNFVNLFSEKEKAGLKPWIEVSY